MNPRWTFRDEANALACCAFRNSFLEDLHAGEPSELLENPKLSRITDAEMKKLMIQTTTKLAELLAIKETDPERYWELIEFFIDCYCNRWEKSPTMGFTNREKPAWALQRKPDGLDSATANEP